MKHSTWEMSNSMNAEKAIIGNPMHVCTKLRLMRAAYKSRYLRCRRCEAVDRGPEFCAFCYSSGKRGPQGRCNETKSNRRVQRRRRRARGLRKPYRYWYLVFGRSRWCAAGWWESSYGICLYYTNSMRISILLCARSPIPLANKGGVSSDIIKSVCCSECSTCGSCIPGLSTLAPKLFCSRLHLLFSVSGLFWA